MIRPLLLALVLLASASAGCDCRSGGGSAPQGVPDPIAAASAAPVPKSEPASRPTARDDHPTPPAGQPLADPVADGLAAAHFAGGCFWCMEGPFEALDGVVEVLSGYTGGPESNPTYEQVSRGRTGHTEAVRVVYDPARVTYDALLDVFWRSMDPTDVGGQFADRGSQYRPGIFVSTAEERVAAEASRERLAESGRFDAPIVVPIDELGAFWIAEDYHQDYYRTNRDHYLRYRRGSGREAFLQRVWGDEAH